ncbi:hypothetical protein HU200_042787 [Digitaria exilis]|uniref:Protein kinase domain-containing protein n=1 Tax=Digitaria exilis TaxID=1010633 RepID=A0A835BG25_9POAL|nr:hypothetical protein HU200_042787 [Digitaria exilis]
MEAKERRRRLRRGGRAALWLWLLLRDRLAVRRRGGAQCRRHAAHVLQGAYHLRPTRRAVRVELRRRRALRLERRRLQGLPPADTVNLTSSYDGGGGGGANSTAAAAWNGAAGINASLAAATAVAGDKPGAPERESHGDAAAGAGSHRAPAAPRPRPGTRSPAPSRRHSSTRRSSASSRSPATTSPATSRTRRGRTRGGSRSSTSPGNALTGHLPASLCRLPSLAVLGLADNNLTGTSSHRRPRVLELVDLSNNSFNGSFPSDFGGGHLRLLNISSNKLAGELRRELATVVPANATVDMSKNNFTGAIPEAGCSPPNRRRRTRATRAFAAAGEADNPARASPGGAGEQQQAPHGEDNNKLSPAAIVAIVVGDIAGVGLLFMLFLYAYHVRKKRRQRREEEDSPPPSMQQKSMRAIDGGVKTLDLAGAKEDKASTSMGCCGIGRRNDGSDSSEFSVSSDGESEDDEELKKRGSLIDRSTPQDHGSKKHNQAAAPAPATLVTVDGDGELEMETLLKASAYILGATGSSIVYKAVLADGTALAVRRIGESGGADKLKDFEAQVRAVARFRHPNILRLRGFYWGADEKLLIHDYAPKWQPRQHRVQQTRDPLVVQFIISSFNHLQSLAATAKMAPFLTGGLGRRRPLHLSLESRLRIARGVATRTSIHPREEGRARAPEAEQHLAKRRHGAMDRRPRPRPPPLRRGHRHRAGASARLFGSKRSMHSTSSLPDLSQMPGPGASPCGSASAVGAAATSSAANPSPYQAPECLKNLRPTAKWDVYAFGMVLLELLSGRVYSEVELCQWHAGLVVAEEHGRVLRMADPTLRGEADGREDALLACFRLAFSCCAMAPGKRPAMRDAVVVLERTAMAAPAGASAGSGAAIP